MNVKTTKKFVAWHALSSTAKTFIVCFVFYMICNRFIRN